MLALALTALVAAAPPPLAVDRSQFRRADRTETRLAAYDRRSGRRWILASGSRGRGGRGTFVGGFSASGDRVAYVEARGGPRWTVARLRVVRVAGTVEAVETLRLFRVRTGRSAPLDAVMTSRGELAWLEPAGVFTRRPGGVTRRLSPTRYGAVSLEDDRTLRLRRGYSRLSYIDLRPARRPEPSCGGRSRFRRVLTTPELVVTRAEYETYERWWTVIRACRREDGRDPVIDQSLSEFLLGSVLTVAGAYRHWVVLTSSSCGRHNEGCSASVRAIEAGTRRRGPSASFHEPEYWLPGSRGLAVSDGGLPAWVYEDDDAARLVVVHDEDVHSVPDTGAPGSIRDLAFSGSVLSWTHAGEPRSLDVSRSPG